MQSVLGVVAAPVMVHGACGCVTFVRVWLWMCVLSWYVLVAVGVAASVACCLYALRVV